MQIKVTKSIHIEQSDFLEDAWVRSLSYAALDRDVLIESVLIGQQREFYYYHNHLTMNIHLSNDNILPVK